VNDQPVIRSRSYQSGGWYAVLGAHVVVLLPPQEKGRVASLWSLADEGSGFEEILDALVSSGLRSLSGFVLIGTDQDQTRVVVRGRARVRLVSGAESVEVEGSQTGTWVERSLPDVTSMVVEVEEVTGDAASYSIEHGLVRVARFSEGPAVSLVPAPEPLAEVAGPHGAGFAESVAAGDLVGDAASSGAVPLSGAGVSQDTVRDQDARTPVVPPDTSGPEVATGAPGQVDDGPLGEAFAVAEPVLPDEPLMAFGSMSALDVDPWIDPGPGVGGLHEPVFTASAPAPTGPRESTEPAGLPELPETEEQAYEEPLTMAWSTAGDAGDEITELVEEEERPEPVTSEPGDDGLGDDWPGDDGLGDDDATEVIAVQDHDGLTRMSPWDDDEFALARPGIPGQEPAPGVTARPVARLVLSDGQRVDVDRVIVLGRAPSASRASHAEQPTLVQVSSPNQEVSSSHAEIRPGSGADHASAVITDLGSTNGTVVAQPGLEPEELQPGVSVQLIPGAIIDLGDGVTIQVARP